MIELTNNSYRVKIIKDSISPNDVRLTTLEVTFPRFLLAEMNTHRALSKNSASSRAIPVEKMLQRIKENPFVPTYWGKNQKGMQADEEIDADSINRARNKWLDVLSSTCETVSYLHRLGIHKQTINRLLEPFMWHTALISATEWSNFFALRSHPAAQPEIRTISDLMQEAMKQSTPKLLNYGEWHLPLTTDEEIEEDKVAGTYTVDRWKKISAGRCARLSYLTHLGVRDLQADIDLCDRLYKDGHFSPLEHPATPMKINQFLGNYRAWRQYRKEFTNESNFAEVLNENKAA